MNCLVEQLVGRRCFVTGQMHLKGANVFHEKNASALSFLKSSIILPTVRVHRNESKFRS